MSSPRLLVTGATGMIGVPVIRRAVQAGYRVTAVVRPTSDLSELTGLDVDVLRTDLTKIDESVASAVRQSEVVVHTAAQVGDWGSVDKYRAINLQAVDDLLRAAKGSDRLHRFVHLSALGVYQAKHHYGTDETTPPDPRGFDGYTNTKAEAETLVLRSHQEHQTPTVIVRPGFTYGAGDRRILPRLIENFRRGNVRVIGDGQRFLNNTYIDNIVDGIMLTLDHPAAVGEVFNMRDERLVSRNEFLGAVADYLNVPKPGHVPEWIARVGRPILETWARVRGATEPPLLTGATMKFMTLNLDFSIEKAKRLLGYQPRVDFREGIMEALDWATRGNTR